MNLPKQKVSLGDLLAEFDSWVTPSLGEIRESKRFSDELTTVASVLEIIGAATAKFESENRINAQAIAATFVEKTKGTKDQEALSSLTALAKLLFLVTARTDNNVKCQFPIFLRSHRRWGRGLPAMRRGSMSVKPIGRVIPSDAFMAQIVGLRSAPVKQQELLAEFLQFVLNDRKYISQLWTIGRCYFELKKVGKHLALLSPLVTFQVRGSVSATGGHGPEELLRDYLVEWGLEKDIDFNMSDVILEQLREEIKGATRRGSAEHGKTRAYDFVFPYRVPGWIPRIFVQCQFYAGDSGSVSHKNVDQTRKSRDAVLRALPRLPRSVFVEYVDGAGYCASLNGDLKRLLGYKDTYAFFQIRSAAVKLRRVFQELGYLTPLELEQNLLLSGGDYGICRNKLQKEGYSATEIARCIAATEGRIELRQLQGKPELLHDTRWGLVRRYVALDVIAINGGRINPVNRNDLHVAVPGYGHYHGLPKIEVLSLMRGLPFAEAIGWKNEETCQRDLDWLIERGFAQTIP